jgi:hypothetical protein
LRNQRSTVGVAGQAGCWWPVHRGLELTYFVSREIRDGAENSVRVLILRRTGGVIHGVPLSQFLPGLFYTVDEAVASHLISAGAAVKVPAAPADVLTQENPIEIASMYRAMTVDGRLDRAADRPARRKPARRRRKPH